MPGPLRCLLAAAALLLALAGPGAKAQPSKPALSFGLDSPDCPSVPADLLSTFVVGGASGELHST